MFPRKKHEIETALKKDEVKSRLRSVVGKSFEDCEFGGTIEDDSFNIYRKPAPYVRNSSNPVILGEIEEMEGGTKIKLRLRLHSFVIFFFTCWLLLLIPCVIAGIVLLSSGHLENGLSLTIGGVVLFVIQQLITRLPFSYASKKAIDSLEAVFSQK